MWAYEVEVIDPRFRPEPIPGTHVEMVGASNVERMAHDEAKAGGWDAARELTRQDLKVSRAGYEDRPGSYFEVMWHVSRREVTGKRSPGGRSTRRPSRAPAT
jgi:hypothetical protein